MRACYNFKTKDDYKLELIFTEDIISDVDYTEVVIIPFYKNNFIMTYHSKRKGWEFPKGTKEENENLLQCAVRTTFEGTGAILSNIKPIGYYTLNKDNIGYSTIIYYGDVAIFEPKPRWSETDLVKLFDELPQNVSHDYELYKLILKNLKPSES